MINTESLSCGYEGIDVVKNVSFECDKGDCFSIVGPNGCGKTTLLRALAGILPYSGSVKLLNSEVSTLSRKQISSEIALMTQISNIYFSYTVFDTVALGRYLHIKHGVLSSFSNKDRDIVLTCLESVGLLDVKDNDITTLSGGQLQRVYLARIFAQEPRIILLDEPTNHLDLYYQVELLEMLKKWVSNGERAIIGVFHDLNLAMQLSNKTLLMDKGEVISIGKTKDILLDKSINEVYNIDVKDYMNKSYSSWN